MAKMAVAQLENAYLQRFSLETRVPRQFQWNKWNKGAMYALDFQWVGPIGPKNRAFRGCYKFQ